MITLYDFPLSGHAHRVRLMLSLLDSDVVLRESTAILTYLARTYGPVVVPHRTGGLNTCNRGFNHVCTST